jgi:aerobic-type carbon monoxide dehydrogenase small subunit (CoxS/CutS family)
MNEVVEITVTVNGTPYTREVAARMHAADFLRAELGLTGTHVGCEQGVCGMCTVIVDGQALKSCLLLAPQLDGAVVETVEGLASDDELSPLQQAFKDAHALQCGFCTPGFLMTTTALAREGRALSRGEIREELAGVLCRCTGYEHIVDAVEGHLINVVKVGADG